MAQLGVEIEDHGTRATIRGRGLRQLRQPERPIDCGNSGTSIRLLSGLCAGQSFEVEMSGDESLSRRPMKRVATPLQLMGAEISGRQEGGNIYPPLRIRGGRLRGIDYPSPVASAQVKSAILLAALYAEGATRVTEPGSSRDHTENMFAYLGVPISRPAPREVVLDPGGWDGVLEARPIDVPGDPSSAAFLVAAGLLVGTTELVIEAVCTNATRTGFLDALDAMNAKVRRREVVGEAVETVASLVLEAGAGDELRATKVAGDTTVRAIDELPILAVVAAFAAGTTDFADAAELRVKESDRIATTCAMLRAFGVEVEERPDGFTVAGDPERTLRAARIDAAGDHRIAMAASVAALRADGKTRIDDVDNVATSFPSFTSVFGHLGAQIREVD